MTSAAMAIPRNVPPPLMGPFRSPPAPDGVRPTAATKDLVRSQVNALLASAAAFHALPKDDQERMKEHVVNIASYAAECVRDVCWQSERLGQVPMVRHRELAVGPIATSQEDVKTTAVSQVARVTHDTLKAVAFPAFVADLIRGTFNAITQANSQQFEQFGSLLGNVQKTVDDFMDDNISDDQARDWLQQTYPDHIEVRSGKAGPKSGADEKTPPNFRSSLHLDDDVTLDGDSIEDTLVPAARRRLAENRLQMLSMMVLMGVNRIVITGGKIRATMGFHIDATDRLHQEHATDMDFRVAAAGSFGFGPWSVSASTSFAYVSSTRANSDDEIHVDTDLTGEVELHFKSDYFPVERFLRNDGIAKVQSNTPVPEKNAPFSEPPPVGQTVQPYKQEPRPKSSSSQPPIGSQLPKPKLPEEPMKPKVERHVDPDKEKADKKGEKKADTPTAKKPAAAEKKPDTSTKPPAKTAPDKKPSAGDSASPKDKGTADKSAPDQGKTSLDDAGEDSSAGKEATV